MPNKRKTHPLKTLKFHIKEKFIKIVANQYASFAFQNVTDFETDFIKERILGLFSGNSIDFNNDRVPLGICNSCRAIIQKNGKEDRNLPLPKLHDYNKMVIRPQTSGFDSCNCLICQVG